MLRWLKCASFVGNDGNLAVVFPANNLSVIVNGAGNSNISITWNSTNLNSSADYLT